MEPIKVLVNTPAPGVNRGRPNRDDQVDRFPFMYMAEGRGFIVPLTSGRTPDDIHRMFIYRLKRAIEQLEIGKGSRFCRRQLPGAVGYWCTRWVPPVAGVAPVDVPDWMVADPVGQGRPVS